MTLENLLLQKLTDWRPDSARSTLAVDARGQPSLLLVGDRNDGLACRLWEVALNTHAPAEVKAWAERVCSRVTGLLEPLRLVEVDGEQKTAQLRSEGPAERDGELFYYEVLLHGDGRAFLRRYRAVRDGSKRREQVGFVLTHEVLAKLAGDLA